MKINVISRVLSIVGILMISIGLIIYNNVNLVASSNDYSYTDTSFSDENILSRESFDELALSNLDINASKAELKRIIVFDNKTRDELVTLINRSLGGILAGHGDVIVDTSLKLKVDPYVATAIMMHETGNGTSRIANNCYNFGGQKGPGCGAYRRYSSVDEGLKGMINNLYKNYYAHGLTTIDAIAPRYAESGAWPAKIKWYVNKIKNA